jgi:hypothetical protein
MVLMVQVHALGALPSQGKMAVPIPIMAVLAPESDHFMG